MKRQTRSPGAVIRAGLTVRAGVMTGIRISGERESAVKISTLIAAIPELKVTRIFGPRQNKTDPGVRIYMNVEFQDGEAATLWFIPGRGKDVTFPGMTAADLRAIADMASAEADEMVPDLGDAEAVRVRLTGEPVRCIPAGAVARRRPGHHDQRPARPQPQWGRRAG